MKFVVFVISLVVLPFWLIASDLNSSLEVTIYSGYSFADDKLENRGPCEPIFGPGCTPEILESTFSVGNSFLFGVGVGYYLNENFEIEGNFSIAPAHQFHSANNFGLPFNPIEEENLIAYNYDANLVYNLDWKGIRPYFTAGIGGITRDSGFVDSDFTYNFGVGSKFHYKNIGFRVELNDHIITDYFELKSKKHNIQIQSGIFFRLF